MSLSWTSFSLAVLAVALSSVAGQTAVQDEYIKNITGVDFSSAELSSSLQLYSETGLYRVAGSVCRVVTASRRSEALLGQPQLLNLTTDQLSSLQLMVAVGTRVQETACVWFNAMFGGVAADESGECSSDHMTSFCLRVQIVNTYLDIYHS